MEQTTPYRRTGAAVLFFIATALTLLNTIILSVAYSASIISIVTVINVLCYVAIAVGLLLPGMKFPLWGVGFAGLALTTIYSIVQQFLIVGMAGQSMFYASLITSAVYLLQLIGYASAAVIGFLVALGNNRAKYVARRLWLLPFLTLRINSILGGVSLVMTAAFGNAPAANVATNLISTVIMVLTLIGTVKAVKAKRGELDALRQTEADPELSKEQE